MKRSFTSALGFLPYAAHLYAAAVGVRNGRLWLAFSLAVH